LLKHLIAKAVLKKGESLNSAEFCVVATRLQFDLLLLLVLDFGQDMRLNFCKKTEGVKGRKIASWAAKWENIPRPFNFDKKFSNLGC